MSKGRRVAKLDRRSRSDLDRDHDAWTKNLRETAGRSRSSRSSGYFRDPYTREPNLDCADQSPDDTRCSDSSYSHVSLENHLDDLDYLDAAKKSAAFNGPHNQNVPGRPGPNDIVTAVSAYNGWWPLKLKTLCRAVVLDRLDGITPEFDGLVRWAARRAIKAGTIPYRAVDLRGEPNDDLF